jgi:hypothetical protein
MIIIDHNSLNIVPSYQLLVSSVSSATVCNFNLKTRLVFTTYVPDYKLSMKHLYTLSTQAADRLKTLLIKDSENCDHKSILNSVIIDFSLVLE